MQNLTTDSVIGTDNLHTHMYNFKIMDAVPILEIAYGIY